MSTKKNHFVVGDKVRYTEPGSQECYRMLKADEVYTVTDSAGVFIMVDGVPDYIYHWRFELEERVDAAPKAPVEYWVIYRDADYDYALLECFKDIVAARDEAEQCIKDGYFNVSVVAPVLVSSTKTVTELVRPQ